MKFSVQANFTLFPMKDNAITPKQLATDKQTNNASEQNKPFPETKPNQEKTREINNTKTPKSLPESARDTFNEGGGGGGASGRKESADNPHANLFSAWPMQIRPPLNGRLAEGRFRGAPPLPKTPMGTIFRAARAPRPAFPYYFPSRLTGDV